MSDLTRYRTTDFWLTDETGYVWSHKTLAVVYLAEDVDATLAALELQLAFRRDQYEQAAADLAASRREIEQLKRKSTVDDIAFSSANQLAATAATDLAALRQAIHPGSEGWTIPALAALAEAHREDSTFMDEHEDWKACQADLAASRRREQQLEDDIEAFHRNDHDEEGAALVWHRCYQEALGEVETARRREQQLREGVVARIKSWRALGARCDNTSTVMMGIGFTVCADELSAALALSGEPQEPT